MKSRNFLICLVLLCVPVISIQAEPMSPILISDLTVGAIQLNEPVQITIEVTANQDLQDISTEIVDKEGYTVLSQPSMRLSSLSEGQTAIFIGSIEPTQLGTYFIETSASCTVWDSTEINVYKTVLLFMSDTLQ